MNVNGMDDDIEALYNSVKKVIQLNKNKEIKPLKCFVGDGFEDWLDKLSTCITIGQSLDFEGTIFGDTVFDRAMEKCFNIEQCKEVYLNKSDDPDELILNMDQDKFDFTEAWYDVIYRLLNRDSNIEYDKTFTYYWGEEVYPERIVYEPENNLAGLLVDCRTDWGSAYYIFIYITPGMKLSVYIPTYCNNINVDINKVIGDFKTMDDMTRDEEYCKEQGIDIRPTLLFAQVSCLYPDRDGILEGLRKSTASV